MNDAALNVNPVIVRSERADWSLEQFRCAIAGALKESSDKLRLAGTLLIEAEKKFGRFGENVPKLEHFYKHIRRIGLGLEIPETWNLFLGRRELQDAIGELSVEQQQEIAEGGAVPLVTSKGTYQKAPIDLEPQQVEQVFGPHCIRDESQQTSWLANEERKAKRPLPQKIGPFRFDEETGTFEGKGVVTYDNSLEMLAVIREWRKRHRQS